MNKHHRTLIDRIDRFLRESGMGPSYFGKQAAGNSELVQRLRNGGRVWPETEQKIMDFIAANSTSLEGSE